MQRTFIVLEVSLTHYLSFSLSIYLSFSLSIYLSFSLSIYLSFSFLYLTHSFSRRKIWTKTHPPLFPIFLSLTHPLTCGCGAKKYKSEKRVRLYEKGERERERVKDVLLLFWAHSLPLSSWWVSLCAPKVTWSWVQALLLGCN